MVTTIISILVTFAIGIFLIIWGVFGGLIKLLEDVWMTVYNWIGESKIGNQFMSHDK